MEQEQVQEQIKGATEIDKDVKEALQNEVNAVPYKTMSSLPALGTVIPISFLGETIEAQGQILAKVGDVDEFLMRKLKYRSKIALSEAFAAEQADAVTMAIYQIENGESLILADQAGTGKGRVCAGILRYAYINGYLPIFITEKDNLFTDIYRDITDIGGIGAVKNEKKYIGIPLIINGYKSGGKEYVEGKLIDKPSSTSILDQDGNELIKAPELDTINEIIKTGILPDEYDFIALTYSQLAARKSGLKKYEYLIEAANNSKGGKYIIVMDECHNATGTKSKTGEKIRGLVTQSSGCLFSSATFSKTPENMYLYSLKNDLRKANVSTKELLDIIKKGGERLIENMAASLAQSGQLLRRERRFDNCNVEYEFMKMEDKDSIFEKYDKTLSLYRELLAYFNLGNTAFYNARKKSIERFAELKKVELCTELKPTKNDAKGKELDELILDWEKRNKGKYLPSRYSAGEINRTQFNFIETLLFALKADFVADIALGQLYGNPDYPKKGKNWSLENKRVDDKSIFQSNRKPVIAVRNTLESIYKSLGWETGMILDEADFIVYIRAIIKTALNGVLTLYEIRPDDKIVEISDFHPISLEDFEDKGERYNKFIEDIRGVKLDIPVSPIDYLIDKIESKERDTEKDDYGGGSLTFKVGEVTGRTKRLKKLDDGRYQLIENPKDKNKAKVFKKFNDGTYDVLLINESGSTGASAHSSVKFNDQRPRVMIIHQVELDVNQEVQKRGRINRTGMVNYPTYIYAISRVPAEIRRLLMLAKKLRKLDANTTGNQKQSKALSQIKDSKGEPIEDVINKYGDEVLDEFLQNPAESKKYERYRLSKEQKGRGVLSDSFEIESFIRQLELATAKEQEYFFNTINILYKQKVEEKKEEKIYDLETEIIDLKAAIIKRVPIKEGDNTSPFNTSVYIEDNKALSQEIPLEKAQVDELIKKLADGENPIEHYQSIYDDYLKEKEEYISDVLQEIEVPDYKSAKTKEEKEELKEKYEEEIRETTEKLNKESQKIEKYFKSFKPYNPCQIPAFLEECYETDEDGKTKITEYNDAKFVGLIISNTAKHKYSPMNIEFVFCQLSGKSKLKIKPTAKGSVVLDSILEKTKFIDTSALERIGLWQVDRNIRRFTKLITGNIIEGYGVAKDLISKDENYSKTFDFIKFTTVDNLSIRYAIRLHMTPYRKIDTNAQKILYNINQEAFIKLLLDPNQVSNGSNAQSTVLVRIYRDSSQIYFLGGIHRYGKSKDETEKKKYYSRFYNDENVKDIANKYGVPLYYDYDSFKLGTGKSQTIDFLRLGVVKSDPNAENFLKELTNYVASVLQIRLELKGVKSDIIIDAEDPYKPDEQKEEVEGEYLYKFIASPERYLETITSDSKFIKYEEKYLRTDPITYGDVYFKFRPNIGEIVSYNIMPVNPTANEMIADTLSVIGDDEKIKLRLELQKAVKAGASNSELASIVFKYIQQRIYVKASIFGFYYKDKEIIGGIFRDFAEGKKSDLPKGEEKIEEESEPKMEKIELNMDTAQEFIILLSSKIK
jgi:hypothetical protein